MYNKQNKLINYTTYLNTKLVTDFGDVSQELGSKLLL